MNNQQKGSYFILYIPYLISLIIPEPKISYLIAWGGSFWIFYCCYSGMIKPLPKDLKWYEQFMRPLFLVQIIFAGYMAVTSIFYWMNVLGFVYLDYTPPVLDNSEQLKKIASCQQLYCLGHAALATGMLVNMKYPVRSLSKINIKSYSGFFLKIALISLPFSIFIASVPGLNQFSVQATGLSFSAGTLALAFALPEKKPLNTFIAFFLFAINLLKAFQSGFKEPIIVSFLVLGVFLYPFYRRAVLVTIVPILLILFFVLPTFNTVFRQKAWTEGVDAGTSAKIALNAVIHGTDNTISNDNLKATNWSFLTGRISEISMFITFKESTPSLVPFEGLNLAKQAFISIVPRLFWPSKPITEQMIMARVIKAGVVSENSNVSAKPAFIADCYLSAGFIGVWIGLFLYGAIAQWLAVKAEFLFGSYLLGNALVFTGIFQPIWRGNSFEFISNNIFWGAVSMYVLYYIFKRQGILKTSSYRVA